MPSGSSKERSRNSSGAADEQGELKGAGALGGHDAGGPLVGPSKRKIPLPPTSAVKQQQPKQQQRQQGTRQSQQQQQCAQQPQQQQQRKKKRNSMQAAWKFELSQQAPQLEQQQQRKKKRKKNPQQHGQHGQHERQQQQQHGDIIPSASGHWTEPAPLPPAAVRMQAQLMGSKKKQKGSGSGLLDRMRARLQGGRFRWLNERLYTSGSDEAAALVASEPELLSQYHEGFREQTRGWPVQPVELALRWLASKPASWAVADLGCGDARVAASARQHVHSFDLVAMAPGVVACNIADVPLRDGAMDAAIFCLSLMGTDYGSFLAEAVRILRPGGWLWIAEVASRFTAPGGASLLPAFVDCLRRLGFKLQQEDRTNSHFFVLELLKTGEAVAEEVEGINWPALKPCTYKKR